MTTVTRSDVLDKIALTFVAVGNDLTHTPRMALAAQHPWPEPRLHLRPHRSGDIGWLIARHGEIYAQEYGFDLGFEALVARIAADFIDRLDAEHEACWIAELGRNDGPAERAGCVMLVRARDEVTDAVEPGVAQLRLLLVEPWARGHGVGRALVQECTRLARANGCHRLRLWTQSNLLAARSIYQREGYRLVDSEPHHSFGQNLVGEIWELALG